MKKIIFMMLLSFLIVGCKEKQEKPQKEIYNTVITSESLSSGIIINKLNSLLDINQNSVIETKYEYILDVENMDVKYYNTCDSFNNQYCSKSIEKITIQNKNIVINENIYLITNKFSKQYEKFLTYLKFIQNKYLIIITNNDGFYSNGKLLIYDLEGKELFKDSNIATNHIVDENVIIDIYPTDTENILKYYTCDIEKNLINEIELDMKLMKKNIKKSYEGVCNITQEYFSHLH